jgi:hypothetical protein
MILVLSKQAVSAQLLARDDTQQWNDVQLTVPVSENFDFNVLATFRIGRDITHLVDRRIGVGFTFRAGKYVSISPNYRGIKMRPFEGRKVNENRLTFPVTIRVAAKKFSISDRNQFERRLRFPISSTRYRNRVQIEHPIKIGEAAFQFFVSDEVFYDWSFDRWVRNRFAAGLSRKFNQHLTIDFYYMRQNDGISRPGDLHIIGAIYRIRL